jgi:hypothetical protein
MKDRLVARACVRNDPRTLDLLGTAFSNAVDMRTSICFSDASTGTFPAWGFGVGGKYSIS